MNFTERQKELLLKIVNEEKKSIKEKYGHDYFTNYDVLNEYMSVLDSIINKLEKEVE